MEGVHVYTHKHTQPLFLLTGHMVALTQFLSSCLEVKTLSFLIARSFTWMLVEGEVDWEVPDTSCEKTAVRKRKL